MLSRLAERRGTRRPPSRLASPRPGLVSSAVGLALVVLSIVGFLYTRHSASQEEEALLVGETSQAATYASSALSAVFSPLSSAAAVVALTDGSPSAFDKVAAVPAPLATVLAHEVRGHYVVTAATGAGFRPGEVLSGLALATVEHARSGLSAGPAHFDGRIATARFAVGPPATPKGLVIYEQAILDPFTVTPVTAGHAFSDLNAVLYGSRRIDPGALVVATTHDIHLTGQVARAQVTVGTSTWLLAATARHSLVGGVARAAPYVILVLGLLMALIAGIALEILQRRHRYANGLVEERTAELNRSIEHLRAAQDALVRGERLTAVGEMATIIGHELRNPLAAVMNALYLIRAELRAPVSELLSRNLSMAETEAHKAATLADDLTEFVRPREVTPTPIDARRLIDEVVAATPPPPGAELVVDVEPFTVVADHGQLAEIVTNLVTNAYQAIPTGGRVAISLELDGDAARLVVEDNGPGIDGAVAGRLFDPFVTTKHKGTGLGLAIVQRLVSAHGGRIDWENVPSGGARFTVVLPGAPVGVSA